MPSSRQIKEVNMGSSSINPSASTDIEFVLNDFMMFGDFNTSLTIESGLGLSTRTTIPVLGTVIAEKINTGKQ